ncbi:MAG: leucine-rich repeat protein [Muribaculaceae bacterium]|nr:leucine-rich repeat protein [Muribaculaceae bacterium]
MNTFYKVLFVLAILIANSISASAIEFTVDGLCYSVNDDNTTVTVAGYSSGNKPTGDLNIPESVTYSAISYPVTSIGEGAFSYCSGLTSVTIPNSVTSIGDGAFEHCTGLTRIDAYPNPEKVSIGVSVFLNVPKDGTLHVLPKYLSAYQTAYQWCEFTNIKGDLTEIGDINLDGNMDVTDVTTLMNMILNGETANLELVDINADGKVNVSDVTALVKIILN